jgi:hypothetical protein
MTVLEHHARTGCVLQQVEYLDLDDDGVPDAVLTVETLGIDVDGVLQWAGAPAARLS